MGLTKQAKTLTGRKTAHLQAFLQQTRYPERNQAILLLSVKAGLRAKEIAALTWDMLTDAEGNLGFAIHLRNEATKGSSGRVIPMNRKLRKALKTLFQVRGAGPLRRHFRTFKKHLSSCHREPIRSLVSCARVQGLL